jgi:hypothetical protein
MLMDTWTESINAVGELAHTPAWLIYGIIAVAIWYFVRVVILDRLRGRYAARPVLNRSEQRLYSVLSGAVAGLSEPRSRLLCQVCYGEFLSSGSKAAFFKINAKRADFLIVDQDFVPLIVVEYQGKGHYGSSSSARLDAIKRDRVKRKALASAGIALMEVPAIYDARSIRETVRAALQPDEGSAPTAMSAA